MNRILSELLSARESGRKVVRVVIHTPDAWYDLLFHPLARRVEDTLYLLETEITYEPQRRVGEPYYLVFDAGPVPSGLG